MEMFLALLLMVYIFPKLFILRECVEQLMTSTTKKLFLTAKQLKQGYRYHKIRKTVSKFYHRHSELIVKYNMGLKALLQQGISEPIFYDYLVYKFKRMVGTPNFSYQFQRLSNVKKKVVYNLDIMRQLPGCKPNHGL